MQKSEIRKLGKQGRNQIKGKQRQEYERKICEQIRASKEYQHATWILSYVAFGGEVSLEQLNEWAKEDGKQLAYPYCTDKTTMVALVPQNEDSWGEDLYGIKTPLPEKSQEIFPDKLELVLTPLVAFDEQCNRTGMGAGVYDRYLPKCSNAQFVGIAFETQKMEKIPVDEHDIPLKAIITEKQKYSANDTRMVNVNKNGTINSIPF